MFKEIQHDTIWDMWISNPFKEGSFSDFKEKILKNVEENSLSKSEKEAKALQGMNQALSLLGGDFIGH